MEQSATGQIKATARHMRGFIGQEEANAIGNIAGCCAGS
jgi:hypothetical protein